MSNKPVEPEITLTEGSEQTPTEGIEEKVVESDATITAKTGRSSVERLRVAATSNPGSVAGSIMHNYNRGTKVELIAVGAAAINQAIKAVIIVRGWVASKGDNMVIVPGFCDTVVEDKDTAGGRKKITAIKMSIELI